MGVLLAFFFGWAVGAKAGPVAFQEVTDAARTVKESEEFRALVMLTRTHAGTALETLGGLVSGATPAPDPADLLARVQSMTSRRSG